MDSVIECEWREERGEIGREGREGGREGQRERGAEGGRESNGPAYRVRAGVSTREGGGAGSCDRPSH